MTLFNALKKVAFPAVFTLIFAVLSTQIQAQQVYRIVGADGKVTFSDQPPLPSDKSKVSANRSGAGAASSNVALPSQLRAVADKFPVSLYAAAKDCAPCEQARAFLNARGIPFKERSISSDEDLAALKRLFGDASLPALSIGSQQFKGFSDSQWAEYLNLAGYPEKSMLPAGYKNASTSPLVAPAAAPAAAAAPASTPSAALTPSPTPSPPAANANPAGIRF